MEKKDSSPTARKRLATKLSVRDIQLALYNSSQWNKRNYLFVPNVSWGLFDYELDLAIMSKDGYVTEIEIKRSWEDFLADFKKKHTHNDEKVYYFYYCVPLSLASKVCDYIEQHFENDGEKPAVFYYTEDGFIGRTNTGIAYRPGKHRKLFLEERYQLARLGVFRFWKSIATVPSDSIDGVGISF